MKTLLLTFAILLIAGIAHAEEYSTVAVCDAIYMAEGGAKATYLYGIRSVHYADVAEAQHICMNTVRHARRDWKATGKKGDFLVFLAHRYCPVNCSNDRGTNKYWLKNVRYWLAKQKEGK